MKTNVDASAFIGIEEYHAWIQIVRLSIVCSFPNLVNYKRFGDEVDGDAGWFLSEKVKHMANTLLKSEYFIALENAQLSSDSLLHSFGLLNTLDLPSKKKFHHQIMSATTWQSRHKQAGSVKYIGLKFPFKLAKLPFGESPVNYGRVETNKRIWIIKDVWDYVRDGLVRAKKITDKKDFNFAFIAGSLQYGGKHHPHQTHRNGANFDLDLGYLPELYQEFGPASIKPPDYASSPEHDADVLLEPDSTASDFRSEDFQDEESKRPYDPNELGDEENLKSSNPRASGQISELIREMIAHELHFLVFDIELTY